MRNLIKLSEAVTGQTWLEALPSGTFHTPVYGEVPITVDKLQRMVANFKSGIRGVELPINYEHGLDRSKGEKAAGWIKDMKVENDRLYISPQFTELASKEVEDKEWKYLSLEWDDEWTQTNTGEKILDVAYAVALTNRPVAKGMTPINFSEVMEEYMQEHEELLKVKEQEEEGVEQVDELEQRLRASLGLADDADIVEHVTTLKTTNESLETEIAPLREAKRQFSETKKFSETFPEEYARMQKLENDNRTLHSKEFSEHIGTLRFKDTTEEKDDSGAPVTVETTKGLSGLALQKIQETHKKFSEGAGTVDDFGEVLTTIMDGGIVDYGEKGSTVEKNNEPTVVPRSSVDARKMFSEKVKEAQNADKDNPLTFEEAFVKVQEAEPELYKAYLNPVVTTG